MSETLLSVLNIAIPVAMLIVAYVVGSVLEKRHFAKIREREDAIHGFPVTTFEKFPSTWQVAGADLVSGSVVVSLDYFKRVIAALRAIVGGRIKTYEPLLDRARREAYLRMVEEAKSRGFDAVINVRLETSRLANARGNGRGVAGVEMLAYGTALRMGMRRS